MRPMPLWLTFLGFATTSVAQNVTRTYFTLPDYGDLPFNVTTPYADLTTQLADNAYFLTCVRGKNVPHAGPAIYDVQGNLIWTSPTLGECVNLNQQTYNDQPVMIVWVGQIQGAGWGIGQGLILDSSYNVIKNVTTSLSNGADLHEFLIPSDTNTTALLTAYNAIPANLSAYGGPADGWLLDSLFQEVDITSGNVIFNWSAADHLDLNDSFAAPGPTGTSKDNAWDAVHINSIDKDAEGNYLLSSRHYHQIFTVSKDTGEILWRLGGKINNFTMGNGTEFFWQHHARWHEDFTRISIFDNGGSNFEADEPTARGLYLAVNTSAMTANLAQQYLPVHRNYSQSQGSMQLLESGNVVIGYGSNPYITEHTADGTVVYSATIGPPNFPDNDQVGNYRTFKTTTWVGHPTSPPSIATSNNSSSFDVYVSWNGATRVKGYTLLGGDNASALTAMSNTSRTGFETHIQAPAGQAYLAVAALASDGTELGRTSVVRASDGAMVLAGSVAPPQNITPSGDGRSSANKAATMHGIRWSAISGAAALLSIWTAY